MKRKNEKETMQEEGGRMKKRATNTVDPSSFILHPSSFKIWLGRLGPFLGLALVIAVFALLTNSPDRYLSIANFRIVLSQTVIVALGAIGTTIIIISGG